MNIAKFSKKEVIIVFSKIIVSSDISQTAFDMIHCLRDLRKFGVETCLLVQCLNPHEKNKTFVKSVMEKNLQEQKKKMIEFGYDVETRVVTGFVKHEINHIAENEDYSIIVTEAVDHSMIGEAILGYPANELIHHAKRPLLLLRVSEDSAHGTNAIAECNLSSHILFPTDFSDNAALAFEYVKYMVGKDVNKVTLVHVQDQVRISPYLQDRLVEFNRKDAKRLQEMKEELLGISDVEVDIQLIYGSPTSEILRLIREKKIPLVVMGSQGRGFIKDIFLGSVSHNISRYSEASVLLIPAKRDAE